jgi:hypothetical protein
MAQPSKAKDKWVTDPSSILTEAEAWVEHVKSGENLVFENSNLPQEVNKNIEDLYKQIQTIQQVGFPLVKMILKSREVKESNPISNKKLEEIQWDVIDIPEEEIPKTWGDLKKFEETFNPLIQSLEKERNFYNAELNLYGIMSELRQFIKGELKDDPINMLGSIWFDSKKAEEVSNPFKGILWGDLSSSEDENDSKLKSALEKLHFKGDKKKSGITLPKDFKSCFPIIGEKIENYCQSIGWQVFYAPDTLLKNQGLISFSLEEREGEMFFAIGNPDDNDARVALASLYASVATLSFQPQYVTNEDNTEVATTYMCSLLAEHHLAKKGGEFVKIALKNGDGGKTVLSGRIYSLCKTGSSAPKLVLEAILKLMDQRAREIQPEQINKEVVDFIQKQAFTSIEGMLANSYRTQIKFVNETYEEKDKKGKSVRKTRRVKKNSRLAPDLVVSNQPLKPEEFSKANSLREAFNDRKKEVERRMRQESQPELLTQPKLCKAVVDEAYQKLASYKEILKARTQQIREAATKLNEGKTPTPGHWAAAKSEVLSKTPDIPESVWNSLKWSE